MNYKIISTILVLALATIACGFGVSIPATHTPDAEVTDQIAVSAPASGETRLTIAFGAGELNLSPGGQELLIKGTATYNYSELKPSIESSENNVYIQTGEGRLNTFPSFRELKNTWNLKLSALPMDLSIEAGAYKGSFEFGGLALTGLTIKDGAADVVLSFSSPNKTEMSILRYETGASNVKLSGLANANFSTLIFSSGAGDFNLDFSGELQRDATATIKSGLSNLMLVIPQGVHAVVTVESGVSNVTFGPGWTQNGNIYTQAGEGPTLTILINIGAGNLTLTR
jgi:hypothetical protein